MVLLYRDTLQTKSLAPTRWDAVSRQLLWPLDFWRRLLYTVVGNPTLRKAQTGSRSQTHSTFGFSVSAFCHCAVKRQHQPFAPHKDESHNTTGPGPHVVCCVALCSGLMVRHGFWREVNIYRRLPCRPLWGITLGGRVQLVTEFAPCQVSTTLSPLFSSYLEQSS